MKRTRQLHLWIGLICSIFILIESITGLLLSERWLLGSGSMDMKPPQAITQSATAGQDSGQANSAANNLGQSAVRNGESRTEGATDDNNRQAFKGGDRGENSGVMGVIRGLHEGRIGQTDVKWLVDLTAIGMIVLTLTGITLSIKTLSAQSISRRRKQQAEA